MLLAQLLLINACFSGDIMGLVCQMISQDRMIKRSRDFFHKEAIEKKHKKFASSSKNRVRKENKKLMTTSTFVCLTSFPKSALCQV